MHYTSEEVMKHGTTMKDVIESNRVKAEAWNNCKESLKDDLTSEQLEKLEAVFLLLHKATF